MAHSDRVTGALWLLEALTAAPGQRIDAAYAKQTLACTDDELDGYLALLSTLADRTGGGRAIAYRDGSALVLEGDAACMKPLRLTAGEGMALAHVLLSLNLDRDLADRLERALLVPGSGNANIHAEPLLANTRSFGACYQQLSEALTDGVRCRIAYRAQTEQKPTVRTIDPLCIETSDDSAYLLAWNVEKQAARRYRLDRVSAVEFTDESVERHHVAPGTVANSLATTGTTATVECSVDNDAPTRWLGIQSIEQVPGTDARQRIMVQVSTPAWLFDEVLAAGGDLVIVAPAALREQFIAYAQKLRGTR